MKKIIFYLLAILPLIACQKDEEYEDRELNLSFKTSTSNSIASDHITVFPNPFETNVIIDLGSITNADILINDRNGGYKRITVSNSTEVIINYSNEKSGVYYCEIIRNGEVFRTYLIKN